jgi:hypothetical protein
VGCAFHWAHNEGMSGHVWLGEGDLRALFNEIESMLEHAQPPVDGGLLVRP